MVWTLWCLDWSGLTWKLSPLVFATCGHLLFIALHFFPYSCMLHLFIFLPAPPTFLPHIALDSTHSGRARSRWFIMQLMDRDQSANRLLRLLPKKKLLPFTCCFLSDFWKLINQVTRQSNKLLPLSSPFNTFSPICWYFCFFIFLHHFFAQFCPSSLYFHSVWPHW